MGYTRDVVQRAIDEACRVATKLIRHMEGKCDKFREERRKEHKMNALIRKGIARWKSKAWGLRPQLSAKRRVAHENVQSLRRLTRGSELDIEGVGRRDRQIQNWIGGTNRLAREWRKLRVEDKRRMTKVAAFEWWISARLRRWRVRSIRNMYLPHVLEAPRKHNRLLEAGLINVLQHCGVRAADEYYSGLPEGTAKLRGILPP